MKLNWKLMAIAFLTVSAFAEEIDAEIIKNLEFFDKMTVVEDMDLIELETETEPAQTVSADEAEKATREQGGAQ